MTTREKTNLEILLDTFASVGLKLTKSNDELYYYIENGNEEVKILETIGQESILHLVRFNDDQSISYQNGFKYLIFENNIDIKPFIYFKENRYQLSGSWQFRRINNLEDDIEKLVIKSNYKQKRINKKSKSLTISPENYSTILADIWRVEGRAKSYRNSVRNYLLNDLTGSYSSRKIKDTTSLQKGEYNFMRRRDKQN